MATTQKTYAIQCAGLTSRSQVPKTKSLQRTYSMGECILEKVFNKSPETDLNSKTKALFFLSTISIEILHLLHLALEGFFFKAFPCTMKL